MPKSENQKLKILYIAQYLLENTDENHAVTTKDIKGFLKDDCKIIAERRSIYRDITILRDKFGMDISGGQGCRSFKLLSRQFEFDDLRLLAQCVYASKFVSASQAKNLIDTLSEFCSEHQAEDLQSEVFCVDRVKSKQKGTMMIISDINYAISQNQKISFKYLTYRINDIHNQVERKKGSTYKVSPYKLLINEGNYYLLTCDDKNKFRTYRIDRMRDLKILSEPREGKEVFEKVDLKTYTKRTFSMYSGRLEKVEMQFINRLLDTVIERFGTDSDVFYMPTEDKKHFKVIANIEVSRAFFGWICSFGNQAVIKSPQNVVDEVKDFINSMQKKYEN